MSQTFREYLVEASEDSYKTDTIKYINSLLKGSEGKTKKMLEGLKKFLDENGFLTDDQKHALGNITKNS